MPEAIAPSAPPAARGRPAVDEFYIGYAPMPRGHGRFVRRVIAVAAGAVAGVAVLVAALQRDPGPGAWAVDRPGAFEGILQALPYPALRSAEKTYLLVDQGKRGTADRVASLDGRRVRVYGHPIRRGSLSLVELADRPDPIEVLRGAPAASGPPGLQDESAIVTLRGEIIDPKCFAGAMKPGDGKPHKACATLCIRGGIPPVLATWGDAGRPTYYLLTDSAGGPLTGAALEAVVPFVADAVELRGARARRGALLLLKLEQGSIRRL